jgi:hypothetical protein
MKAGANSTTDVLCDEAQTIAGEIGEKAKIRRLPLSKAVCDRPLQGILLTLEASFTVAQILRRH